VFPRAPRGFRARRFAITGDTDGNLPDRKIFGPG